jgi:hypothetical protein
MCFYALACSYGPNLNAKIKSTDFLKGKLYISSAAAIAGSSIGALLSSADRALIFAQQLRFSASNESEWLAIGQTYYDKIYSGKCNLQNN